LTRTWSWLGASILAVGCRYVVSFDDFASGGVSATTAQAAGNGGGGAGQGGATGGAGADPGGGGAGGTTDVEAGLMDVRPETSLPPPILVYSAPPGASLRGIAVFGPDLFWVENGAGRGVFRMSKQAGAGNAQQLQITPNAYDVAVDASFIYWSEGSPSYQVFQMPITGGVRTMPTPYFAHNAEFPRYLVVDDLAVAYVTTNTGSILSGITGMSAHPYAAQTGVAGIAFYMVADAGVHDLLWGYGAGIRYGPTRGSGSGTDIYTGATDPVQGIATDGQDLFWISNGQAIKKGEVATAAARETICFGSPQDFGPFADIAVDEQWVYFTWPSKNQIYKCLK
jgi:hypothetical protein